jgi:cellulose synthase/poly-beta-1,6-N-acetylglucosamine synthase-like glycosyltransferase
MMSAWSFLAMLALVRLDWAILVYFVAVNTGYALLMASAACELVRNALEAREESRWRLLGSRVAPSITVLVPAHNEAATIIETVRGFLALYYPNLEVLVVNDGSTGGTMAELIEEFELAPVHPIYQRRIATKPVRAIFRSRRYPNLWVADKDNGGKADALNAGLNMATGALVCSIDADTLIEPDALQRMVRPFFHHADVVAAGGTIRVVNGCPVRGGRVIAARADRIPGDGVPAGVSLWASGVEPVGRQPHRFRRLRALQAGSDRRGRRLHLRHGGRGYGARAAARPPGL